jgi:hypothetical protein
MPTRTPWTDLTELLLLLTSKYTCHTVAVSVGACMRMQTVCTQKRWKFFTLYSEGEVLLKTAHNNYRFCSMSHLFLCCLDIPLYVYIVYPPYYLKNESQWQVDGVTGPSSEGWATFSIQQARTGRSNYPILAWVELWGIGIRTHAEVLWLNFVQYFIPVVQSSELGYNYSLAL